MSHNEPNYKGFRGDSADDLKRMEAQSGALFGTNEFASFFGFPLPNPVKAPVASTNQRPGVLASPLQERTSGTATEGRNVATATNDITQEQADF